MSIRAIARVGLVLGAIIVGGWLAVDYVYPLIEPAAFTHEIRGVDVSAHQGVIDWDRLKGAGVQFAYIKASEGENFNDPRFSRNWYAAEQAGILRGAYHFFTLCRPGKVQAANFIRVVPPDPNALPPVIDAEHMGPCKQSTAVADVAAEIAIMLDALEAQYKMRPILYTTREFHDAYLAGKFPKERFWIRSLVRQPRFREQQWVFWQYHNRGSRSGVSGPVDLNAFRGTRAELEALRTR
ncbi:MULTISPECIES: GH25 family lysozyme [Rhodomicrobium]|uniref:glycoside hydrolase family 25 protein n=1 Tax=Rhodomicrobium TaxID=1068 RepID=UPI0014829A4E|nr:MULTISPECIES: GH25 family lysozyme [Rhodomicrobium]